MTVLLLLGGAPPTLFRFFATVFGETYFHFIGSRVAQTLGQAQRFSVFLGNLQGGNAFVAVSYRVAAAFLGSLNLKRVFVTVGIFHCGFEIWLLPTKRMNWCKSILSAACNEMLYIEQTSLLALYALLVFEFAMALILSSRQSEAS